MEQLLNDLQHVLDQLKAASTPAVDPLRTAVEERLVAEGWVRPASPVNVPVTVEDPNEVNEG